MTDLQWFKCHDFYLGQTVPKHEKIILQQTKRFMPVFCTQRFSFESQWLIILQDLTTNEMIDSNGAEGSYFALQMQIC